MKIPATILFDLDNTLTDHTGSSREALRDVYDRYESECFRGMEFDLFFTTFTDINTRLWQQYVVGEIDVRTLRHERMRELLESAAEYTGTLFTSMPDYQILSEYYLERYVGYSSAYDGIPEMLEVLHERHTLGIVTNGFADIQDEKLRITGIGKYFTMVLSSESFGVLKPDPAIFKHALELLDATAEETLYVGDNFFHDICGAARAGLKTIWYNPGDADHPAEHPDVKPDTVARSIPELERILLAE